jgi:hypothetical protein
MSAPSDANGSSFHHCPPNLVSVCVVLCVVGCVRVWDTRVQEPVLSLEPEEGQPVRDCWTVAFGTAGGPQHSTAHT